MRNLDFFIVVLFYFAAFQTASSQETDTLKQGDFLDSSNQLSVLVSANKLFVLGFYSPPSQNPPNVYLAIWFNDNAYYTNTNDYTSAQNNTDDYTSQHPVWIGNRNTPIRNTSALLFLNSFGNLFIKGNGIDDSFPLYSSVTKTRINATATLLDSGNFVVRETNSNGSAGPLLWQSFDYPTDTLLPGMKLGVNQRTGKNLTLTSWFYDTSPRDGAFSLEWDPQNLRLVIRCRGVIHWTSGGLKQRENMSKSRKGGFMEKVFEFFRPGTYVGNYEFIWETNEDGDEDYFYYRVYYGVNLRSYSNKTAWLLDYEGNMYDTKDKYKIAVLDSCYGTINRSPNMLYAQGCESWEQPKCRNNHQKFNNSRPGEFRKPSGELVLSSSYKGENISSSDCREVCWRDCNCFGYLFNDLGCQIWQGQNLKFYKDPSGNSTRPYVLMSDEPNFVNQENPKPKQKPNVLISEASNKRKSKKWIPFAAAALVSLAILLFGLAVYMKRKRRQGKEKELLELMTLDGYTETVILKKDGKKGQDVKLFSYSCIVSATNNFSPQNKLGQGGFGPVYKGQLPEGQEIAVKRLSKSSEQGLQEFKTELLLIAKLQHTNLVRLFGCCIHGDEKMLIYEYMPNKSLDFFLFETSKHHLCWERRFIIIEGIAQGLLYLHKYSRLRIIHRDLKASNILLDENMNPKISDFGTARIFKKNLCEESTIKITGTRGYMAPEYILEGTYSIKSDVFSFGVLMLEIVSGRKNNSLYDIQGSRVNLVAYAWELWNRNSEIELMDLALSGSSGIHDQVERCIRIGLLCVQHSAILRPTMSEVISLLSNGISALPVPGPPAFFEGSSSSKGNTGSSSSKGNTDRMKSDKNSETELSISEIRAR